MHAEYSSRFSTLVLANTAEAFAKLINRYENSSEYARRLKEEHRLGDRALLWGSDNKVVVTSMPAKHTEWLTQHLPYHNVTNLYPEAPSWSLCRDILREPHLRESIVCGLRGCEEVTVLSYVASDELYVLADALQSEGLRLRLQDSPSRRVLDSVRRFDTKSGFRILCGEWSQRCRSLRLPEGTICSSAHAAARVASEFLASGRACICKADIGESGNGLLWLEPGRDESNSHLIEERILTDPAFGDDHIVVEATIDGGNGRALSPSTEVYVDHDGRTSVTYSCVQHFSDRGEFCGVLIDRSNVMSQAAEDMNTTANFIGAELAQLGYVGHFDIDYVLDSNGSPFAVEGNLRRTGGTHAHELTQFLVGGRYAETHVVLSRDSAQIGGCGLTAAYLISCCEKILFPIRGAPRGLVPSIVASMDEGRVGYVIIGESGDDVRSIEREFLVQAARACLDHTGGSLKGQPR